MLSTHLRLGLPSGVFPCGFLTNNLYMLFSFPIRATYSAHLTPSRLDNSNYTWWRVQITQLLVMQFAPPSPHFIPLRSNIIPIILFSNTVSPIFLPSCQEASIYSFFNLSFVVYVGWVWSSHIVLMEGSVFYDITQCNLKTTDVS
jgi:hypothetical protein